MIRRLLILLSGLLLLLSVAAYIHYDRWQRTPLPLTHPLIIEIHAGDTLTQVVRDLLGRLPADVGWQWPHLFTLMAHQQDAAHKIQVGEYRVDVGTTPGMLLRQMLDGRVLQHEFRIIEGTTVRQLLAQLAAESRLQHTLQAVDQQQLAAELKLAGAFSEGMFFPDTYLFRKHSTDRELLLRANKALQSRLNQVWQSRAADTELADAEQALVLASIIEKESARAADQKIISQVFHNRLRKGMRLQTDPTVIYGLGASFDGDLTRQHLRTDTAYNTYTRHGLPPTPIALVSEAALQAAVHPSNGNFLYFVARGDGSSQFSKTLEEHNAAVRRFQLRSGH